MYRTTTPKIVLTPKKVKSPSLNLNCIISAIKQIPVAKISIDCKTGYSKSKMKSLNTRDSAKSAFKTNQIERLKITPTTDAVIAWRASENIFWPRIYST